MFDTNAPVHSRAYCGCRNAAIDRKAMTTADAGWRAGQGPRHEGARFSRKACMPSAASAACAFSTITPHVERVRLGLVHRFLRVERALPERDHIRARAHDAFGERRRRGIELLGRDDAIHQPPVEGGRRIDHVAGQQHLEHPLAPDRARDRDHRRRAEQPDVHAGCREAGGRRTATARSHTATSWQPAAVATPPTLAITGCGIRCRRAMSATHVEKSSR